MTSPANPTHSYQVLARKWRPRTFSELVGQEATVQTLSNALNSNRLHHAYLFTGTRGVGKTTIARILAKAFNCETGITATPCGICANCIAIDQGRFMDLFEVDAASKTKIEDTRELLDNVQFLPTQGRFNIYLIDEVHMLSRHSFNALLKTLEEPPEHTKFFLATTDPQKLPATILSRCLKFNLKKIPADKIAQHLDHLLDKENIDGEATATALLAYHADGSLRDALSLLDQAIAHGDGHVSENHVRNMLGIANKGTMPTLMKHLAAKDPHALLQHLAQFDETGGDFYNLLEDMLRCLHALAVEQAVPNTFGKNPSNESEALLAELAQTFSPEDVQLYYQMALKGKEDIQYAPSPKAGMEIIVLRMLLFTCDQAATPIQSTQSVQNTPPSAKPRPNMAPQSPYKPSPRPATTHRTPQSIPKQNQAHPNNAHPMPAVQNTPPNQPHPAQTHPTNTTVNRVTTPIAPTTRQQAQHNSEPSRPTPALSTETWHEFVKTLRLSGLTGQLANHSRLKEYNDQNITLEVPRNQISSLNASSKQRLHAALENALNSTINLTVNTEKNVPNTPAERHKKKQSEHLSQIQHDFSNNPTVQKIQQTFDGTILTQTVQATKTQ